MKRPILTSKLYLPVPRTPVVPRPRLFERLNEGLDRKLTLITASAGFGKTTLVGSWAAGCGRPAAWLSLDDGDNDPARFLLHAAAALQPILAESGADAIRFLESESPPPAETTLTLLLNAVSALPFKLVFVLDDYHVIHANAVDTALAFMLEHLPPQLHLVVATREEPRLPLSRLRAQGQVNELRAADLRFTSKQADAFFHLAMGLTLAAEDIALLERRTEGWIAGLQLAGLSMQGRTDLPAFIRSFAGDNRYIMDYLIEEVLQRQPEPIRAFLLQTSILDRLHGPLCNAVTGREDGREQLEALEKGGFFLVPLDDRRHWYRYHPLFAEVLSARLMADHPDLAPALHRRASRWYEHEGLTADAVRHALTGEDHERAAAIIELAWPELRRSRQGAAVLGWLKNLPEELVRGRPVLCVEYAWALLAGGELAAVEKWLAAAERWLAADADTGGSSPGMAVADPEEFHHLAGTIAGYRAACAQVQGDIPSAIRYARQLLELVPPEDPLRRGAASALLGLSAWTNGELETAHRLFADGMRGVLLAGNISDAIEGSIALAEIRIAQGRLRQARETCERGLLLAEEHGQPAERKTADLHTVLSELCRESNELEAALEHLQLSQELSKRAGRPHPGFRWFVAAARIAEAQGRPEEALARLEEAERRYTGGFFPWVRPISAMKARVWAATGRLEDALVWVREQSLTVDGGLSYMREFEHLTLARVLLARYRRDRSERFARDASVLLKRMLSEAERGGRTGSRIEIGIVQALAYQMQGELSSAIASLKHAMTLAGSEGYVRIFTDEGPPLAVLLEEAVGLGAVAPKDAAPLLAALPSSQQRAEAPPASLIEPLSDREREVLRLFRTDLSGPEIALRLHVSLHTLRSHTKHIYNKLQVNNRRAAVRRAEELDLF